jgi:hypothetical protein
MEQPNYSYLNSFTGGQKSLKKNTCCYKSDFHQKEPFMTETLIPKYLIWHQTMSTS